MFFLFGRISSSANCSASFCLENSVEIFPIIANKERSYFPVKSTMLLF